MTAEVDRHVLSESGTSLQIACGPKAQLGFGLEPAAEPMPRSPRRIRFWDDLVEGM